MVNSDTLMILSSAVVMILTRNGLYKTQKTFKKFKKDEEDDEDDNELPKKENNTPYNEFKHTSTLILKYDLIRRYPVMIRQFKDYLLTIVYCDGLIQVVQYSAALINPNPIKPKKVKPVLGLTILLGEFRAHHFPSPLIPPTAALGSFKGEEKIICNVFDASPCETFGSNCYVQELFTVGYDFRIIHWGVRYVSSQDTTTVAMKVHNAEDLKVSTDSGDLEDIDPDEIIYTEEVTPLNGDSPVDVDYLGVRLSYSVSLAFLLNHHAFLGI